MIATAAAILVAGAALWIIWRDAGDNIIPNPAVALLGVAWIACAVFVFPIERTLSSALVALVVFGIGFLLFSRDVMGGGDVKLLACSSMLIETGDWVWVLTCFYAAFLLHVVMLAVVLAIRSARHGRFRERLGPALKEYPLGVPSALTLLAYVLLPLVDEGSGLGL